MSAKGIPIVSDVGNAIASGGEAFVDGVSSGAEVVGNEVVSAGTQTLNTLEDAGMAVGTAAANGAVVVGNGIAEGAESTFNAVAPHVVSFGNSLGEAAVSVGNEVAELGERVVDETVTLAGTVLDHAKKGVEQGAKMVNKVGKAIGDKMTELGQEVAKLGPIIAGLAKSAWNEIKDFVSCLAEGLTLCSVLIGEYCDCNAGSYIKFSTPGVHLGITSTTLVLGLFVRGVSTSIFAQDRRHGHEMRLQGER